MDPEPSPMPAVRTQPSGAKGQLKDSYWTASKISPNPRPTCPHEGSPGFKPDGPGSRSGPGPDPGARRPGLPWPLIKPLTDPDGSARPLEAQALSERWDRPGNNCCNFNRVGWGGRDRAPWSVGSRHAITPPHPWMLGFCWLPPPCCSPLVGLPSTSAALPLANSSSS